MYATRAAKPKLSLSISAVRSPGPATTMPRTPVSPQVSPSYPRDLSSLQPPQMYAYTNSSSAKSILKKARRTSVSSRSKRIQFENTPTVHCITPIENKDEYYGGYVKMSRDERRWGARS